MSEEIKEVKASENTELVESKEEIDNVEVSKACLSDLDFYPELKEDFPVLRQGDMVKVSYRVIEGGKERIQVYEGVVIALKNKGIAKTITVRKVSFGVPVERIFPLNSPLVQKIDVVRHSKVRRAKLYYLRSRSGKAARLKELRK